MTSVVEALLAEDPFTVTCASGRVEIIVVSNPQARPPIDLGLVATSAEDRTIVRFAGGCKGLSSDVSLELLEYHVSAMNGFRGALMSGGTRSVEGGATVATVTEAAVAVHRSNPGTVVIATVPRTTGNLGMTGSSQFVLGTYDEHLHPGYDLTVIVQDGCEGELTWHGDLPLYFKLFASLKERAKFRAAGVICSNGGDATEQELIMSAKAGYPTFLIQGFERKTDEYALALQRGQLDWLPQNHGLVVVDRKDPSSLRDALAAANFFPTN